MSKPTQPAFIPPEARVLARCPFAADCGGCSSQDVAYDFQVQLKRQSVDDAFAAAGLSAHVSEIIPCPDPFYYRNRMDYAFGRGGELGLKAVGRWWETLDITTCYLLSPETPEILRAVREWTRSTGLPFWDSKTQEGFFRYLVVREGKNTSERLVELITSSEGSVEQQEQFRQALDSLATHILWGVNGTKSEVSRSSQIAVLKGGMSFKESINGITYAIEHGSFFQTNSLMAAQLQDVVVEAAANGKQVMDLYCGAGFFTLALAKRGIKTMGIEIDPLAIEAAKANAKLNNLDGIPFVASKTEDYDWTVHQPDTVIVDPPRAGLHPDVIDALTKALPERIIYVSCKYEKLIEELPAFLKEYTIEKIIALDLFPHTPHVEVVVCLHRVSSH